MFEELTAGEALARAERVLRVEWDATRWTLSVDLTGELLTGGPCPIDEAGMEAIRAASRAYHAALDARGFGT